MGNLRTGYANPPGAIFQIRLKQNTLAKQIRAARAQLLKDGSLKKGVTGAPRIDNRLM
jgi:hypothetical protein